MTRRSLLLALPSLAAAIGCGGANDEAPPAQPIVSVQKLSFEKGCYETCPSSTAPAAEIDLSGETCGTAAACGFMAGSDRMRVIVDYGSVELQANVAPPSPTITLIEDEREVPAPAAPVLHRQKDGRVVFSAGFTAPAQVARTLSVRAKAAEGFSGEVDLLSIDAPDFTISVAECTTDDCAPLAANVGRAHVTVTAPIGTDPRSARLSSRLNGVPLAETAEVALSPQQSGTVLEGTGSLLVPAGDDADVWGIDVTVASTRKTVTLLLQQPALEIVVPECVAMPDAAAAPVCSVTAGKAVTVVVTAPHDIHLSEASLTYELDGVPATGQPQTEAMDIEDVATRSAVLTVPIPNAPGSIWLITGRVGRYTRQARPIKIGAP
ncbi:hypothetical protein predicted by Glimmer/Critica [Sorangium cellulosum So ce56]|uniref:Secreted protein n=1 Tax=Sorangium cellulosum (strain So ce56) TaxID=448385 RepID=A9GJ62_SORC5|nr:hypothetical protein [Sorangium cellulosum]CAN93360.1 hypothetical protein predicted by Glimmer/Critica [Sorangium cellulosum So ce56]